MIYNKKSDNLKTRKRLTNISLFLVLICLQSCLSIENLDSNKYEEGLDIYNVQTVQVFAKKFLAPQKGVNLKGETITGDWQNDTIFVDFNDYFDVRNYNIYVDSIFLEVSQSFPSYVKEANNNFFEANLYLGLDKEELLDYKNLFFEIRDPKPDPYKIIKKNIIPEAGETDTTSFYYKVSRKKYFYGILYFKIPKTINTEFYYKLKINKLKIERKPLK